jgi:hypothetical protein
MYLVRGTDGSNPSSSSSESGAAHLPRLLEIAGASTTTAIAAAALVGPAQVAARLVESGRCAWCIRWFRRVSPRCCIRSER